MITKKIYHFKLESQSPNYRGEPNNNFTINGFGFLESYGENSSLEIQLKEDGQRIPMDYQVWLAIDEKGKQDKKINLGGFRSAEEKIIKWQAVFSSQDLQNCGCLLEQIKSVTIKGTPQETQEEIIGQTVYFLTNELGNPEIEIILEEGELEQILETQETKEQIHNNKAIIEGMEIKLAESMIADEALIFPEMLEELQNEDRVPEAQETEEWEKALEKILSEPEEKIQAKKNIWKLPEPLTKKEEQAPMVKITFN